jgi:hypothetical protein
MSDLTAVPGAIAAAATDVAAIGSTVDAAHMTAAAPTVAVVPAAADEVSAGIANLFSGFANEYHALAGQAAAFQQQFVQLLHASGGSYTAAETVNVASMLSGIESSLNSIAAMPGELLKGVDEIFTYFSTLATLSMDVVYELLVFGYLTLAIFIGLEELALKYAGIVITIP